MNSMILAGTIVYSEKYAKTAAKYLDGKVDYVLVDAEKKIHQKITVDHQILKDVLGKY